MGNNLKFPLIEILTRKLRTTYQNQQEKNIRVLTTELETLFFARDPETSLGSTEPLYGHQS